MISRPAADMNQIRRLEKFSFTRDLDGTQVQIAGLSREGDGPPIVFLHGFGSTKEDYADVVQQSALHHRPVIAFDAPGFGDSRVSNFNALSIPFLVKTAELVLQEHRVDRFDLIGHSMGGLTALLLANSAPERVLHFINIEGNVAPEDCFLSRQILDYPELDAHAFMQRFIDRVSASRYYGSALYASTLAFKVRAESVYPIFSSMVDLSDNGGLLDHFLALPMPRCLMYGEQNASLSYLPEIRKNQGVELVEIPKSGHFPMYSNPVAMWKHISRLLTS